MTTIVVAVDASARATAVLDAGMQMAHALDGKLLLLRAVPALSDVPLEAFAVPLTGLTDAMLNESRRQLARLAEKVPAELLLGQRVETGVPWRCIVDVAKKEQAGLIVIGAHGYNFLERSLGTTAARVVDHADRNVLVVRTGEARGQ